MSKIEEILSENLITSSHINQIFNVFTLMNQLHTTELTPLDFRNFLSSQTEFKDYSLDNDLVDYMFMKIDINKDGVINFEDFLTYIYSNMKLIISPLNYNNDSSNSTNNNINNNNSNDTTNNINFINTNPNTNTNVISNNNNNNNNNNDTTNSTYSIINFTSPLISINTKQEKSFFHSLIFSFIVKSDDINQRKILTKISKFNFKIKEYLQETSFKGTLVNYHDSNSVINKTTENLIALNTSASEIISSLSNFMILFNNETTLMSYYSLIDSNNFNFNNLENLNNLLSNLSNVLNPVYNIVSGYDLSDKNIFIIVFQTLQRLLPIVFAENLLLVFNGLSFKFKSNHLTIMLISDVLSKLFYFCIKFFQLKKSGCGNPCLSKRISDFFRDNNNGVNGIVAFEKIIGSFINEISNHMVNIINEIGFICNINSNNGNNNNFNGGIGFNSANNEFNQFFYNGVTSETSNTYYSFLSILKLSIVVSQYDFSYIHKLFNNTFIISEINIISRVILESRININNNNYNTSNFNNNNPYSFLSDEDILFLRKISFSVIRISQLLYEYSYTQEVFEDNNNTNNINTNNNTNSKSFNLNPLFTNLQNTISSWYNYFINGNDLVFQIYFFFNSSFLTRKLYLNDKEILSLFQKTIIDKILNSLCLLDTTLIIDCYFFYIENLLLNTNKKDSLFIISEINMIEFAWSYLLPSANTNTNNNTNTSEDLFSSVVLDIIERIYSNDYLANNIQMSGNLQRSIIEKLDLIIKSSYVSKLNNVNNNIYIPYSIDTKIQITRILVLILDKNIDSGYIVNYISSNTSLLEFIFDSLLLNYNKESSLNCSCFYNEEVLSQLYISNLNLICNIDFIEKCFYIIYVCCTGSTDIPLLNIGNNTDENEYNSTRESLLNSSLNQSTTNNTNSVNNNNINNFDFNNLLNSNTNVNNKNLSPNTLKFFCLNADKLFNYKSITSFVSLFEFFYQLKTNTLLIEKLNSSVLQGLNNHAYHSINSIVSKYHIYLLDIENNNIDSYDNYNYNNSNNSSSNKQISNSAMSRSKHPSLINNISTPKKNNINNNNNNNNNVNDNDITTRLSNLLSTPDKKTSSNNNNNNNNNTYMNSNNINNNNYNSINNTTYKQLSLNNLTSLNNLHNTSFKSNITKSNINNYISKSKPTLETNNSKEAIQHTIQNLLKNNNHYKELIKQSYCYYKYELIPNSNFLLAIIECLRNIYLVIHTLLKKLNTNSINNICSLPEQELKSILAYLTKHIPLLEKQYKEISLKTSIDDVNYEIEYDGFIVSTQSKEEILTQEQIHFYFKNNDTNVCYEAIKKTIEDSYCLGELNIFYKSSNFTYDNYNKNSQYINNNDGNDRNINDLNSSFSNKLIKIRNDDDLWCCLEETINDCRKLRKNVVILELFITPAKRLNNKFILKCQNCDCDYYVNENDLSVDNLGNVSVTQPIHLCEDCKYTIITNYTKGVLINNNNVNNNRVLPVNNNSYNSLTGLGNITYSYSPSSNINAYDNESNIMSTPYKNHHNDHSNIQNQSMFLQTPHINTSYGNLSHIQHSNLNHNRSNVSQMNNNITSPNIVNSTNTNRNNMYSSYNRMNPYSNNTDISGFVVNPKSSQNNLNNTNIVGTNLSNISTLSNIPGIGNNNNNNNLNNTTIGTPRVSFNRNKII